MKARQTIQTSMATLLIATLCTSCVTKPILERNAANSHYIHTTFTERLWHATSANNDVIEIPFSKIPEADLVQDGIVYTKDEERQLYYIEGSSGERIKDISLRIIGMPAAVAADLCLEGVFVLNIAMAGTGYGMAGLGMVGPGV